MKLAEALQERADLNRQIEQLRYRLSNNATVQENEETAEDPNELLKEVDRCISRLQKLMAKINHTNATTMIGNKTLTECIAERDCLKLEIQIYQQLINNASQLASRATHSEIRILSAIDVKATQKKLDNLSKKLRTLDNQIQSTNWSTEI